MSLPQLTIDRSFMAEFQTTKQAPSTTARAGGFGL